MARPEAQGSRAALNSQPLETSLGARKNKQLKRASLLQLGPARRTYRKALEGIQPPPKRKPGSGLTRRACYVWLQRPSPLGFSMPVNPAPFISLWFHGNVQNAQQVQRAQEERGQREAWATAEAPSTQRPAAGSLTGCGWAPTCQSAEFSPARAAPPHHPGNSACGSLSPGLPFPALWGTSPPHRHPPIHP